ncbi:MAG: 30S ribosomal protein S20 [Atopococcus tabaci]|uniref:Small ribosomal subunit protein bS20 n=1 Tax=Atopococcus tabaci TaxID=269774 RepID=A0AA43UBP8_9LACT|nr:30S ribosomal protein S20 [Atopococcus tabaci]
MPNLKSAIKRVRQSDEAGTRNKAQINSARTAIRKFEKAIEENDSNAGELHQEAVRLVDKAKSSGLVHENKANRIKSRLTKLNNA